MSTLWVRCSALPPGLSCAQEYELAARELHLRAERGNKALREDLELRRKQEVHELEERKNGAGACCCNAPWPLQFYRVWGGG